MGRGDLRIQKESRPSYEDLEEWVRLKVQEFVQEILEEEVTEALGRGRYERRKRVDGGSGSRNGYGKRRRLSLMSGTIEVKRPRVRDSEEKIESRILPLFKRRTRQVSEMIPELYLHGLAKGDFELALRGLLGAGAPLSAGSIQRLKGKWQSEYEQWKQADLSGCELVYLWADGLYVKAGIEKEKAALLVIIGAMRDGTKRVLAVESGYRESTASWASVLRALQRRGLRCPRLTIADGHLGIWSALAEVYPDSEQQRCWNHKIVNVLDQLPRKVQPQARELLCRIPYAETSMECEQLRDQFRRTFGRLYAKAAQILENDWERMVTFYKFPREHWVHLRTSNVVESPFASARLRTNAAKRHRNVSNATALIWKLLMVAERRFRRLKGYELLEDVFKEVRFVDGIRTDGQDDKEQRIAA
jgi:putative transposase